MKKVVYLLICYIFNLNGQVGDKPIFSIDDQYFYKDEIVYNYKKNIDLNSIDKDKFLDNFINYKLIIKYAKDLKLDTMKHYKNVSSEFKKNIILSNFYNDIIFNGLLNRLSKHIYVSLFKLNTKDSSKSYEIYNKIRLKKKNKEKEKDDKKIVYDGFVSAMELDYKIENIIYNLKENEFSKPFFYKNNYYIAKTGDIVLLEKDFYFFLISMRYVNRSKVDNIYKEIKSIRKWENIVKNMEEYKGRISVSKPLTTMDILENSFVLDIRKNLFDLYRSNKLLSKPFKVDNRFYMIKIIKKLNKNNNNSQYNMKIMNIAEKYGYIKNVIESSIKDNFNIKYDYIYNKKSLEDFLYPKLWNHYKDSTELNLMINDFNDFMLFNLAKGKGINLSNIKDKYIVSIIDYNFRNILK